MRTITLWTQDGCSLCAQVKEALAGEPLEERDVAQLLSGADKDDDAMAQLAMQDMQLPVVRIDGQFLDTRG